MLNSVWKKVELPEESQSLYWEQLHENSKTGHYDRALSNEQVLREMKNLYETLPYNSLPAIPLPTSNAPITNKFEAIIQNRVTAQNMAPSNITLEQWRTILHFAYGETRSNKNDPYIPRPFRTVPSGGALYPLELYFFSNGFIQGLEAGLYHYSPSKNQVELVKKGDISDEIASCLVAFQSNLAHDTAAIIFITAMFNRSIFKYRDRGYRFVLIEAGHVAQNINLTATALDLGVINIGGYHDRLIDKLLKLDGLNHSTIYLNGICQGHQGARSQ